VWSVGEFAGLRKATFLVCGGRGVFLQGVLKGDVALFNASGGYPFKVFFKDTSLI